MRAEPAAAEVRRLRGTGVSPGIARGRLFLLRTVAGPGDGAVGDRRSEAARLNAGMASAMAELEALIGRIGDADAAAMLEFQLAMIDDDSLRRPAFERIGGGSGAGRAWIDVVDAEIADYEGSGDEYFRSRVADLRDIRDRVLRHVTGSGEVHIPGGRIVVTDDLPPSLFLSTPWGTGGVALTAGSGSSHVSMLARSWGVPMVVGLGGPVPQGEGEVFLDGTDGELILAPTELQRRALLARSAAAAERRREEAELLLEKAVTGDGEVVRVLVNVASLEDLAMVDSRACDGIGLVRTELLFHDSGSLPGEEEQADAYRRLLAWAGNRPVTVRLLDAGGDKPAAGIAVAAERNPFLGVRGIRLLMRHPQLLRTQLRALLRSAAGGELKIMLPMVTVPAEVVAVRGLLDELADELGRDGCAVGRPTLGMMVEVPSAAIAVDEFEADFYSIGSNDLIQYVTACSRDAEGFETLARPDNSAVLRLIEAVAHHGAVSGREVSVCGEMAGDPCFIDLLLARGIRTLSVAPSALARTKAAVRRHRSA